MDVVSEALPEKTIGSEGRSSSPLSMDFRAEKWMSLFSHVFVVCSLIEIGIVVVVAVAVVGALEMGMVAVVADGELGL